jgi:hypothetical protein
VVLSARHFDEISCPGQKVIGLGAVRSLRMALCLVGELQDRVLDVIHESPFLRDINIMTGSTDALQPGAGEAAKRATAAARL